MQSTILDPSFHPDSTIWQELPRKDFLVRVVIAIAPVTRDLGGSSGVHIRVVAPLGGLREQSFVWQPAFLVCG